MGEQELQLINGLQEGNEQAYRELFVRHYDVLCHVALQVVGDAFLAESLVSDTIAHVWEIRHALEIRSSLRSYLMRAVRNRCFNYLALECENHEFPFSYNEDMEELGNSYASEENPLGTLLEK
ncbi:MAG TPA: RNA polymerase sigma-70 factor, partial [Parabacteroides sp.]|nr:RNA polymerase sigma-70 factor [Parabacteroides sp.]